MLYNYTAIRHYEYSHEYMLFSVLLQNVFKHFFMLLLFLSLYLLYYCDYYLVISRLNVSFIETNEISCGQFKRGLENKVVRVVTRA